MSAGHPKADVRKGWSMKIRLSLLTCLIVLSPSPVLAEIPSFQPPQLLVCDGERIDVGSYAAPLAVDWDGDGLKDLICGQFEYGRIRFYRNVGTGTEPVFDSWTYLMDGWVPLSVPYG